MSAWTRTNSNKAQWAKLRPAVARLLNGSKTRFGGTPPGSRALADAIEALQRAKRRARKVVR